MCDGVKDRNCRMEPAGDEVKLTCGTEFSMVVPE